MDIEKILTEGIVFRGAKAQTGKKDEKVKTKAKKKTYITGLHGSGSAKMRQSIVKDAPTDIKTVDLAAI